MKLLAHIASPSGIVVIETMLLAILNFAVYSILLRVSDTETIGLWVLANSLLGFSRVADFWSRGLSSFVAEALGRGNGQTAAGFVSTAALTGAAGYLILAGLGTFVVYLLADSIAGDNHAATLRDVLPLMAMTFWLTSLAGVYQLAFFGFGRPLFKVIQTLGGALLFLLAVTLLAPAHGLAGILLAQVLQGLAMLAFALVAFHGFIAPRGASLWQSESFTNLVKFGGKVTIVGVFQLAIDPLIRLIVNFFCGLSSVAVVDLASRLIALARGVIVSLGQILVPAFAHLSAEGTANVKALYRDTNRLFLLVSIPTFSLMLSAAPFLEEILFGHRESQFLPFIWILSAAWFANVVTAPAHFFMLGRRQLRPLLWSHVIMTVGAILLGSLGGLLAGVYGALGGVAVAFIVASAYLAKRVEYVVGESSGYSRFIFTNPAALLPLVAASLVTLAINASSIRLADAGSRFAGYSLAIAVTFGICLVVVRFRDILMLAGRIKH